MTFDTRIFLLACLLPFGIFAQAPPAPQPTALPGAQSMVYKTIGDVQLMLHVFYPGGQKGEKPLPAIIFFFGGGWNSGTVEQFVPHSQYLAERGMIAVVADYRVRSRHGVTPFACVADARSAIRWLRQQASSLGIDASRIAAAGGSAGGHLAATAALAEGQDEKNEDLKISARPDVLILFNPVLDMPAFIAPRKNNAADQAWMARAMDISPQHQVKPNAPPTLIFHGTADSTVPYSQAIHFHAAMQENHNRCTLVPFEGRGHGFFNFRDGRNPDYATTLRMTDEFLVSLGYLKGQPTTP